MIPLSTAALVTARKPGFAALLFSDVKAPSGNPDEFKQAAAEDLGRMGLIAKTRDIFLGPVVGRDSARTTMAVVGQPNDDADRFLRSVVSGRPLCGSVMQPAANVGAIPLRDGNMHATVKLLPFGGEAYATFAFVETALLLNESHAAERLDFAQRAMINPMVRQAAGELIAAEEKLVQQYAEASSAAASPPEQRTSAVQKATHHRGKLHALQTIAERPDDYFAVATQPLQGFPVLDALDATAQLLPRDDSDRDLARRRSALGWAFARQAAIATVIVRKGCESAAVARAAMAVARRLLHMPTPPAASALRPTGTVAETKLVPPSRLAENRITTAVIKAKLHVLACDQPWGYDAIANAGEADQTTYTIPHTLANDAAAAWATAFRTASNAAGAPVDVVVNDDEFAVTTLPTFTREVHIYSVEDVIIDANGATGEAVSYEDVIMEPHQAESVDPTPTPLRRAVDAQSLLPSIVRWSRSQPPGNDPLPWHAADVPIPTATPAGPGSAAQAVAVVSTVSPPARFEGLTQTISRVNAIESALAQLAQSQAATSQSIVQLTANVTALVQHAGIANALPPPPPPPQPVRSYAAIAGAPANATAPPPADADRAMPDAAVGAAATNDWHGQLTPADGDAHMPVGAPPSAENGVDDDSMPAAPVEPVALRTRASLALAHLLAGASGATPRPAAAQRHQTASTSRPCEAEDEYGAQYDAATDSSSEYVLFEADDEADDAPASVGNGTLQMPGESSEEYETRLNATVPAPMYFCCRPEYSWTGRSDKEAPGTPLPKSSALR
jgi:hypothetical protein